MRAVAVLLCAATACGARGGSPAWPKSAGTQRLGSADADGGESLEPHMPKEVAAVEAAASDGEVVAPAPAPVVPKPTGGDATATPPAVVPDAEQPIMLDFEEEIVIDATP